MSQLFMAYRDKVGNQLICGNCAWVMRSPKVLVVNGDAKLVECQHCFQINKVTEK
jgi:hypothetical protein